MVFQFLRKQRQRSKENAAVTFNSSFNVNTDYFCILSTCKTEVVVGHYQGISYLVMMSVDICGSYRLAAMETTLFTTCTVWIPCYRHVTIATK